MGAARLVASRGEAAMPPSQVEDPFGRLRAGSVLPRKGERPGQDTKVLPYGGGVRERPVDRLGTCPTKKGGRPGQDTKVLPYGEGDGNGRRGRDPSVAVLPRDDRRGDGGRTRRSCPTREGNGNGRRGRDPSVAPLPRDDRWGRRQDTKVLPYGKRRTARGQTGRLSYR